MPYEIQWDADGAEVRFQGACTGQEVLQAFQELRQRAQHARLSYVIHDASGCESWPDDPDESELMAVADLGAEQRACHVSSALVATHPDVLRRLGAAVSSAMSPCPTRVFHSLDAARAWTHQQIGRR